MSDFAFHQITTCMTEALQDTIVEDQFLKPAR